MHQAESTSVKSTGPDKRPIWWSMITLLTMVHFTAVLGMYYLPPWSVTRETLWLCFITCVMAGFGVTIGYHRLYSHRAFRATFGVRIILTILGTAACQGSIKWWCLRHRMHHVRLFSLLISIRRLLKRLPPSYAPSKGLFYAHIGWLFHKPTYERMEMIERDDLMKDPIPLTFFLGFVCPALLGSLWHETMAGFVWGGLVARLISALAHWKGLQPYSDEDTSKSNFILALFTAGEGNHNFSMQINFFHQHSFPHDFRSGPSSTDWDPSKWIIVALQQLGLVSGLRRASDNDLVQAVHYMKNKNKLDTTEPEVNTWEGEIWNIDRVKRFAREKTGRCIILIDGFAVDVTPYLGEHPGGATLLRKYSVGSQDNIDVWHQANWAFFGGANNHSRTARRRMQELRVAKLVD
ncbi:hypothetical protein GALMADRAFT_61389 [Galerina marginata CBS 339.88]|uniref:Cytochrome b5 heme-binding domain-containing protein n=1 Tax=Galerina marginata (strain CBS 339.88) TaxID=685588 RepID=A0A067TCZ8_GALM3|nr:hypothetical protein GALMADRAFT_61389 [Galerina marginata CBS 339.88]